MTFSTTEHGVFINGRAQVVEMLQQMTAQEKEKIFKHLRIKNPTLASELIEESFTFQDINNLADEDLKIIFQYVSPQILGVALKNVARTLQRRILSLAERGYAQEAYQVLISNTASEKKFVARAQKKIITTMLSLHKNQEIIF